MYGSIAAVISGATAITKDVLQVWLWLAPGATTSSYNLQHDCNWRRKTTATVDLQLHHVGSYVMQLHYAATAKAKSELKVLRRFTSYIYSCDDKVATYSIPCTRPDPTPNNCGEGVGWKIVICMAHCHRICIYFYICCNDNQFIALFITLLLLLMPNTYK